MSGARDGHGASEGLRFFPVGLDLRGRRCLVVGGGVIGTRKALTLAHSGAAVTVVSPEVSAALADAAAAGLVHHVAAPFEEAHLDGAFLVVAATDDEDLNDIVAQGAAEHGALVCDASSAERSQVSFGAMLRRDDATVAVFTDGRDPGHARRTRDRIAGFLDRVAGACGGEAAHDDGASSPDGGVVGDDKAGAECLDRDALVMIGASLAGAVTAGRGRAPEPSTAEAFAEVRKSHRSVRDFLDRVLLHTPVCDAMVWNTCQRMELYATLPANLGAQGRRQLEDQLRGALFDTEPEGLRVGVLRGIDAQRHLLRTVCGLNSELPGDRDVAAQLETACHSAHAVGAAGPSTMALVHHALDVARNVVEETTWGDFAVGYCSAALSRVFEEDSLRPEELRYVVIGGSTTSRSVLTALRLEHQVPERQLAIVYRQHHGQMKELRAAIGNGRRLRVHGYRDERVLRAVAGADVVVFGIDHTEPVMDAATFVGTRDLVTHPITVVDFNPAGSVAGIEDRQAAERLRVWSGRELDRAVAAHVAITTTRPGFAGAVAEAEARIDGYLAGTVRVAPGSTDGACRPSPAERTGFDPLC